MEADTFEIIEDVRRIKQNAEDENKILLRKLLEQLGTTKLIVEQEDIDVSVSEPQDVDGPIIEDYFCESGVSEEPMPSENTLTAETSDDSNSSTRREKFPDIFGRDSDDSKTFVRSQNLSASVMLTAPLADLAKPAFRQRRNSLPIMPRRRGLGHLSSGYGFLIPEVPDRSKSTPAKSSSATVPQEAGEIEHTLSLPTNGFNLFEVNAGEDSISDLPTSMGAQDFASLNMSEKKPSQEMKCTLEKSVEDVGSSLHKLKLKVCPSTPVHISPSSIHSKQKIPDNLLTVVSFTTLTIYPVFQENKLLHLKLTDLVFAMIITTILFWSYRELEIQRLLRTNLTGHCGCEQPVLNSTLELATRENLTILTSEVYVD